MESKIFIIVNPTAGEGKAKKIWQNFEYDLKKNNIHHHAVITEYQNHATELISRAVSSGYNRIGVFSGDGTLNEVLQGLFHDGKIISDNLKLIFFPAGSSCDFEKKINSNKNWIQRIKSNDYISFLLLDIPLDIPSELFQSPAAS